MPTDAAISKRDRILDAALHLFAERGFDGTSVPLVAERAEVGAGTIYRYFDSKEMLVNELFRHWKKHFRETLLSGYPQTASIRAQFQHIVTRLSAFALQHAAAFSFLETHNHGRYLDATSLAVSDEFMEYLRKFVAEGIQAGAIRPMPVDAVIAIVYGAFVGVFKAVQAGDLEATSGVLKEVEGCCWAAICLEGASD